MCFVLPSVEFFYSCSDCLISSCVLKATFSNPFSATALRTNEYNDDNFDENSITTKTFHLTSFPLDVNISLKMKILYFDFHRKTKNRECGIMENVSTTRTLRQKSGLTLSQLIAHLSMLFKIFSACRRTRRAWNALKFSRKLIFHT